MDREKVLKQLREQAKAYGHCFSDSLDVSSIEEWKKMDCPYCWHETRRIGNMTFLTDYGYGWLALVIDDKVHGVGKDFIRSEDGKIIVLGEYYGYDRPEFFKMMEE